MTSFCQYVLSKRKKHPSNFTKSNTLSWVFFTLFKLYKWYQIAQRITYVRIMYCTFNSTESKVEFSKAQRHIQNLVNYLRQLLTKIVIYFSWNHLKCPDFMGINNYFCKQLYVKCLTGFCIRLCMSFFILIFVSLFAIPAQLQNLLWHHEKACRKISQFFQKCL